MYQLVAAAVRDAGAKLSRPGDGIAFVLGGRRRMVRYVLNVATLASTSHLFHTHDAHPMERDAEFRADHPDPWGANWRWH